MTIPTLDATSTGIQGYGSPTLTISHTCSGADRVLLAMGGCSPSADIVTGVTYNGVAMTRVLFESGSGASATSYVYVLVNPPTGAHNIVWTMSNTTAELDAQNASWNNVDQTTPVSTSVGGGSPNQNSPRSDSITVPAGGIAVDIIVGFGTSDPFVIGAGQTQILQNSSTVRVASSYKAAATAMSWSWGAQRQLTHIVLALNPVAVPDTTAPTMTGTMTTNTLTSSSGTVDWSATTRADDVAITGYEYKIDSGSYIDAGNVTSKNITSLAASTAFVISVRAYDAAGNKSTPALTVTLTTSAAADTTPPVFTGTLTSSGITATTAVIDWSGTTHTDNVAITSYDSSIDGGTTWVTAGSGTSATVTGLTPSSVNTVKMRANDAAGNHSTPVLSLGVTTPASSDTTLPVQTGSITPGAITNTTVAFTYPAATDNVAVTGYEISKDGGTNWVPNGTGLSGSFTGLAAGTGYPIRVRAFDAAGNRSTPTLAATITTTAAGAFSTILTDDWEVPLPSVAGWTVFIHDVSSGALLATKTSLSTNGSGVIAYSDVACTIGTNYRSIYKAADGTEGMRNLVAA